MDKICFDGIQISNKNDIYDKCAEPNDAEAIYNFLVTGNKVLGDAPNISFFIDAVTYLVVDECLFFNNGLIDISDKSLGGKFIYHSKINLLDILGNIIRLKNKVIEMKLTGSFKIKDSYGFENNPNIFRVVTTNCSYVGGVKIPAGVSFRTLKEYLNIDKTTDELFPLSSQSYKDIDGTKHYSVFFESDINAYIEQYYGGYDGSRFKKTAPTVYYKDGEKDTKQLKTEKVKILQTVFDKTREETYQLIVAALFAVLRNPERPDFNSQEAIYRHLEKHFSDVKGLSASNLRKLIPEAKKILSDKELDAQLEGKYQERFGQAKI